MRTDIAVREDANGLAGTPLLGLAGKIAEMTERTRALGTFYKSVMEEGTDYGLIPGTPKPTLLQPGAQMLDGLFGLSPRFEVAESSVEDWPAGFFAVTVICRLISKTTGEIVAEGIGSCNSKEGRYRWRAAQRTCPTCGQPAIIKGKQEFGGGWVCFKKTGGCGGKWPDGADAIESQPSGRVENDDPYTLHNTILKMSQKRCLGGTTAMLFRTSRGETRADIKLMYDIYAGGNQEIEVPGVDGVSWRRVEGMVREEGRPVFRVDLADGSYIRATGEHRFPTGKGLKTLEELKAGDSLLRAVIDVPREGGADTTYAWVAGLFKTSAPLYNASDLEEIVSIERETKLAAVYDIQVDGDHLFCLGNGIQTHNSHVAATLNATGASRIFTQDVEDLDLSPPGATPPAQTGAFADGLKPPTPAQLERWGRGVDMALGLGLNIGNGIPDLPENALRADYAAALDTLTKNVKAALDDAEKVKSAVAAEDARLADAKPAPEPAS